MKGISPNLITDVLVHRCAD